jgi:Asp-tRNA(Asn)/Glu-tRNA(Gln) amidotransferase A subunit family amidase
VSQRALHRLGAAEIATAVRSGTFSCEAVARAFLERIAEREPAVLAFEHLDPAQVLAQARALDERGRDGPLLGVPVAVKDIIDTRDMPTAYGSPIYAGHRPVRDATCVALSRRAGAIVMGKAVTAEFAVVHPGKTRHPIDPSRTPGGSSSGSAAAVAADMVPLALGTQTTGSTIKPASYCGVFGYRPTFGTIRCAGIMESAGSCDTVGLYARTLEDIALYRDVLAGTDPVPVAQDPPAPRIGFCRTPQWDRVDPAAQRVFEDAAARLVRAGAQVAEAALPAEFDTAEEAHRLITSREFVLNFAWEIEYRWDDLSPALRAGKIRVGLDCNDEQYRAACRQADVCRNHLDAVFERYDVLLAPATTGEAPVGTNTGDSSLCSTWTLMHVPVLSVPVFTGPAGLPLGAQLIGARGEDRKLFAAARWVYRNLS